MYVLHNKQYYVFQYLIFIHFFLTEGYKKFVGDGMAYLKRGAMVVSCFALIDLVLIVVFLALTPSKLAALMFVAVSILAVIMVRLVWLYILIKYMLHGFNIAYRNTVLCILVIGMIYLDKNIHGYMINKLIEYIKQCLLHSGDCIEATYLLLSYNHAMIANV